MKSLQYIGLLGGLLATVSAPVLAQSTKATSAAISADWKEVRELTAELDTLIAARKLSGVHDAVLNLRDAVRELRPSAAELASVDKAKFEANARKLDTLAEQLHETADHNDLRGTVQYQRKLHVLLDELASITPKTTKIGPITAKGPAKDPVCRMTVDPATAAGKMAYNGQTYYFCSASEVGVFKQNPQKYAALYDEIVFGKPKQFGVSLSTSGPVKPGRPTTLAFSVRETGKKELVRDFQEVHEMLLHLIIVTDDLSWFAHEHPLLAKDGRFYLKWTPPRAGRYWMYADFTPAAGANTVAKVALNVPGTHKASQTTLRADQHLSKTVESYRVAAKLSAPLRAGRQSLLSYTLTRHGKPVTNMEPYLGAMGHMIAIHQKGKDAVHTHTVHPGEDPETGLRVTSGMATKSGPIQTFKLEVPTPGLYKVWAQFGVPGKILTVPFTFHVQANPNMKLATSLTAGAALAGTMVSAQAKTPAKPALAKSTPQKITVTLPNDYREGAATVKAGKPVALTFFLKSNAGCGNTIALPAAKWKKDLTVGQKATVVYTPKKSGPLTFECGMGHMKGTLTVK